MNNDTDHLEIWVKISTQIGELNGFIKTALDKLADHEKRIDILEKGKNVSFKDNLIQLLVKGLVASIFVIGSITGASAMIKHVLGL